MNDRSASSSRGRGRSADKEEGEGKAGGAGARRAGGFRRRRKACPFSRPGAAGPDYKDISMLGKFVSERGKIVPSRISAVSPKMQRRLAQAIKRARILALMPFAAS